MRRKTLLLAAPLGLGALVIVWAAMASRGEPESNPVRPAPKAAVVKAAQAEIVAPIETPVGTVRLSAPAAPAPSGGEYSLIEDRIRKMEEQLLTLQSKRDTLSAANQDLEKQIVEKSAEQSARMMAEWRVRGWEQPLGLTETQKQALLDLVARWHREDAGKPASRDTWLTRESELRSRLTAEQSAKLHDSAVAQSQAVWNNLGKSIGSMVGAAKEDQTRFQQALGDYRPANTMLMPEGYGADWQGMMRESFSKLQPLLSADQMAKLGRYVQR